MIIFDGKYFKAAIARGFTGFYITYLLNEGEYANIPIVDFIPNHKALEFTETIEKINEVDIKWIIEKAIRELTPEKKALQKLYLALAAVEVSLFEGITHKDLI